MLAVAHGLVGLGVNIEQTLYTATADDVLLDNLGSVLGLHLGVEGVVRHDLDNGALLAEAEATGSDHIHLVGDTVLFNSGLEVIYDFVAVGRLATGTAAAQHLQVLGSRSKTTTLL